jgi:hypothetical protein
VTDNSLRLLAFCLAVVAAAAVVIGSKVLPVDRAQKYSLDVATVVVCSWLYIDR